MMLLARPVGLADPFRHMVKGGQNSGHGVAGGMGVGAGAADAGLDASGAQANAHAYLVVPDIACA